MGNIVTFDRLGSNPNLDDLMGLTETRYTSFIRDDEKHQRYMECIRDAKSLDVLDVRFDDPDDPLDSHFLIITFDLDCMQANQFGELVCKFDTISFTQNGDDVDVYLQMKDIYKGGSE